MRLGLVRQLGLVELEVALILTQHHLEHEPRGRLSTASALAPAAVAAELAASAERLRLVGGGCSPSPRACSAAPARSIHFSDSAFVLPRPLLRLLDRLAERVNLVVHFADARADELLRRAGRRAADGEHGNGIATMNFPEHDDPPRRNRARLPRVIPTPGSNRQILAACTDHERMPARFAARFECNEVLMPQLVDDLLRRGAALGRHAGDERVAARPGRQIRQRP